MKRIRCLFYIGKGTAINKTISAWTWTWNMDTPLDLAISHGEIWTADEAGTFWHDTVYSKAGDPLYLARYAGDCWTSTLRDDAKGTVVRDARLVLTHPEHWIYQEFEVPERNELTIEQERDWIFSVFDAPYISRGTYSDGLAYMQYEVDNNQGYATRDLYKFVPVLRHIIRDKERNICTEFTHNAEVCFGILPGPFRVIDPRSLWKLNWKIHHCVTKYLPTGEIIHDGYRMVPGWRKKLKG